MEGNIWRTKHEILGNTGQTVKESNKWCLYSCLRAYLRDTYALHTSLFISLQSVSSAFLSNGEIYFMYTFFTESL